MVEQFGGVGSEEAYKSLLKGGSSGFAALLGGGRSSDGSYLSLERGGSYWSSTADDADDAWSYNFNSYCSKLYRFNYYKSWGRSCRCIQ